MRPGPTCNWPVIKISGPGGGAIAREGVLYSPETHLAAVCSTVIKYTSRLWVARSVVLKSQYGAVLNDHP